MQNSLNFNTQRHTMSYSPERKRTAICGRFILWTYLRLLDLRAPTPRVVCTETAAGCSHCKCYSLLHPACWCCPAVLQKKSNFFFLFYSREREWVTMMALPQSKFYLLFSITQVPLSNLRPRSNRAQSSTHKDSVWQRVLHKESCCFLWTSSQVYNERLCFEVFLLNTQKDTVESSWRE